MIRTVTKRNGKTEPFSPEKLNKLSLWATKTLTSGEDAVDWSHIALQAIKRLYDGCSTTDIINALIQACIAEEKESYLYSAGKLLTGRLYKEVFEDNVPPSLVEHLENMADLNRYRDFLSIYTEEELEYIESHIDHSLDFTLTHSQVKKAMDTYLLKDKDTKQIFETPQFMYIRIALAVCESEKEDRHLKVIQLYNFLKHFHTSLPTPMWKNLGTPNRVGTSCLLMSVEDSLGSLNAGDNIAYTMTTEGAGIGSVLFTRSVGQKVDNGRIIHGGKIPYYRLTGAIIEATLQEDRGGAATTYINVLDPEIEKLLHLRNATSIPENKVDSIDYSVSYNQIFLDKVAKNEDWMLIDYYHAEPLWKAMYDKTTENFEILYEEYLKDDSIPKTFIKAREIAKQMVEESQETGRLYEFNTTNVNNHTAYKDPIFSSNLCVAGSTPILTDKGYIPIIEGLGQTINIWNGTDYSEVIPQKTGEFRTLYQVTVESVHVAENGDKTFDIRTLDCTAEHKWYNLYDEELETSDLEKGQTLYNYNLPDGTIVKPRVASIIKLEGTHDTYCVNEPKFHKVVFNGILTGNCSEIVAPTKPFRHRRELDKNTYEEGDGWVQTCTLCAINLNKDYDDREYEELAYWSLKIIDYVIETSHYSLPQVGITSKKWRTAGVSLINLAHHLATHGLDYSSIESKKYIHNLFERHEYFLLRASLRISKERGLAEWIGKTKYPEGYIPLDDYNKNVDSIADFEYKYDWQQLKQDIKDNGGIAHTALSCEVPSESSSILANATNSIYPVRGRTVVKTGAKNKYYTMPPQYDSLNYQLAFDVPIKDLIHVYAIAQKFLSQTISADFYYDKQKPENNSNKALMTELMMRNFFGLKTKYYSNIKSQNDKNLDFMKSKESTPTLASVTTPMPSYEDVEDSRGCSGGSCSL